MAGTVVVTETNHPRGGVRKVRFAWTSDALGAADTVYRVAGIILRAVFNPGATAPTAAYDVTLKDENLVDVLAGQGADLAAADTTSVCPGMPVSDGTTDGVVPVAVNDNLTLSVTNAGASKQGTLDLYLG